MTSTLPLDVRAINGAGPSSATAQVAERTTTERLRGSAGIFGMGVVVGLLFLPIPLIHLFGIIIFLACTVFAFRRFRVKALVRHVAGTCPSCQAETTFFVGGGMMAARWPLGSQCGACGIGVRLTPHGS